MSEMNKIQTDLCIVGAGPVGLFAVFEAGLLKMRCHIIDALPQIGGQLSEIYPRKPIYDIPGIPEIKAQELIDGLQRQIEPFKPTFTLGERVEAINKDDEGHFTINTSGHSKIRCKAVVIAGGLGCFEPRKPDLQNLQHFEGKGVFYLVKDPETFRGKRLVIAGGGDSALDWTIHLAEIAERVTLVHRNETFRGAPDTAEKVFELARMGRISLMLNASLTAVNGNGLMSSVSVEDKSNQVTTIPADNLIPLFGLSPKLGPLANWGLNLDKNAIVVNTKDFATSEPGVFAIGDINTYPGKLKLILCGFHEAALMAQAAFTFVHPHEKISFKYTTVNGVNAF
jgi:thioredoxin reductase (NADPH)